METEIVALGNGLTWQIKAWLSRGDRKEIARYVQRAGLQEYKRLQETGINLSELRGIQDGRELALPVGLSVDEEDALLLYGTVAWGYPEPVSLEAILSKPERITNQVLARMKEFYYLTPEAIKN